jgi:predicted permease
MPIGNWLDSTGRNVRHAVRALGRTPVFTATVVLTLALGIGANSAVFSAIDAVVLRALPFPEGDQLVRLAQIHPRVPQPFVAPIRLEEWNRLNSTFQGITGYYTNDVTETSGELPEKLTQALVAPRFLRVWRVAPALGRDFTPQEERFGGPSAALISDRLWRRRFSGRPDVIGRTLRVGRSGYTIVGVMPATFLFPVRDTDFWSPSPPDAPYAQSRESTWFTAIGRLEPGVSLARARADLETVQAALGREYPKTDAVMRPGVESLKEATVGGVTKSLWILFGSVSLLLLIACTNIAALLLSRAAARQHEVSLRFSLGASRASVAAQLLAEVLVLALAGAFVGLLLAAGASGAFRALAGNLPRVEEIALDWRVVLYSLGCAVMATLLCGTLPALRGTRQDLAGSLAQAGRSQVAGRHVVQFVLVGVQVALAVTLLAGAGLLVRSFQELGRVNPGFDAAHVLVFDVSTNWGETVDQRAARQRTARILEAVGSLPGVEATTAAVSLPGVPTEYQVEVATPEGRAESEPKMLAQGRWVTPGYFATLRIPVVAGEPCREEAGTSTMMVNRAFAHAYLGGVVAIGRRLTLPSNPLLPPAEIRGIVGDARETGLDRDPVPTAYWCSAVMQPGMHFLARTHGAPQAVAEAVRRRLRDVEPGRSVYDLTPLGDHLSEAYGENRFRTMLLAFFALTAVSLACIGLYGTLSYLVHLRQREMALRLALGAIRRQVVREVLLKGLRVSLLGCAAGLPVAALSARLLMGMLYGVSASDPATLAGTAGIVLAVSALASLLPAVRASRLDPMRVLRED